MNDSEQLDLLQRSLDAIPKAILITDCQQEDDPIVYVNKYFLEMSGYSKDEVIGQNCRFMQGEETDHESLRQLSIAVQNRDPIMIEMVNYRKNGDKFINHFNICPVFNSAGDITHCVAIEEEV